jgi:glycosyltransferase involved in cell wall biosynthesis
VKRIGVLLGASPGGGVFQYAQSILDALHRLPHDEYELVAAYVDPLWVKHIDRTDFTIFRLRESFGSRVINRLWDLTRFPNRWWRRIARAADGNVRTLVGLGCDLWICPSHERWAFRAPIPALGTIHDLMHRYEPFPEVIDGGEYEAREFHFAETCRWARGILVDSETGKRHVCESYGVAPGRVFALPYIPPRYIYETATGSIDDEYDLPGKFFFYPAQFWKHKNHPLLIEALSRVREKHPDVALVLAGSTRNGYDDAIAAVKKFGLSKAVIFLGYVPDADMAQLYQRARALVSPTLFGPTNIPPLEAFALGCPVAAGNIYAVADQLGDAALLFDPRSVTEMASTMTRLWEDDELCRNLAERGLARADAWGPPQFAERLREIIDLLVEPPTRAVRPRKRAHAVA